MKEPVETQLRKKLMDAVVEATGAGTVTVIGGAAWEIRFEFGRLAETDLSNAALCGSIW